MEGNTNWWESQRLRWSKRSHRWSAPSALLAVGCCGLLLRLHQTSSTSFLPSLSCKAILYESQSLEKLWYPWSTRLMNNRNHIDKSWHQVTSWLPPILCPSRSTQCLHVGSPSLHRTAAPKMPPAVHHLAAGKENMRCNWSHSKG